MSTGVEDFVITGAIVKGKEFLATSTTSAGENPSQIVASGVFLTFTYTRLPDRPGPTQP
jgi:hypothetical protein